MNEYIERNDLIKNLNTFAPECYSALINDLIMKQPAADVAHVKHGEWKGYTHSVFFRLDKDDNPICRDRVLYYCSECSRRSSIKTNYCQNCGAKMDEGDKNAR